MIPELIKILNNELPDAPGVYFYYDSKGKLLYVGKATSLKKRVGSYFIGNGKHPRTAELVSKIAEIKYIQLATVIEALVLEANQIRIHKPPYNILGRDDKSFIYLCITSEDFPKPILMRGLDLERIGIRPFSKTLSLKARKQFLAVYGPYLSSRSLKTALDLIRRSIPWSKCNPPSVTGLSRPCFDAQIGKCPGVCSGAIDKRTYRRNIKKLMLFFEGKKDALLRQLKREMAAAAKKNNFEAAAELRNRVFALEHIQDISLLTRDDDAVGVDFADLEKSTHTGNGPSIGAGATPAFAHINAFGRIEAYDIANISGTSNVAAMVVFEGGKPNKSEYRKFRIKTPSNSPSVLRTAQDQGGGSSERYVNDVGAMEEVMRRRLARLNTSGDPDVRRPTNDAWPLPDLLIIDGGEGQVNRVRQVLREFKLEIPVVGIAKGFDRKQDRLVFDNSNPELRRVTSAFKEVFQKARDEAHRFAGAYHRNLRGKQSGIPQRKKRR